MKTTRKQQDETRTRILQSAVDLMTRQGYDGTTMKDIARAAGIGDATIYKYFPTKDRVVLGYFDQALQGALDDTRRTPGVDGYGLQEKLQRLTDAVLERLLAEREFVVLVRSLLTRSPLLLLGDPLPAQQALRDAVAGFIAEAEAGGEIETCDIRGPVAALYADYLAAVIAYWLADESEGQADTAQLVDLSLGLLVLMLRVGLFNRLLQLGGFVLRSQLARLMRPGAGLLDLLKTARHTWAAAPPEAPPARPPRPRKTPARPRRTPQDPA